MLSFWRCPPCSQADCTELRNSLRQPGSYDFKKTALATCVSFGVGLGVISLLMNFISRRSFLPFALYRILLGGTLLLSLSKRILRPL